MSTNHWMAFYVNDGNVTYFDSFGIQHISNKKFKKSYEIKLLQQIFIE